MFDRKLWEQIDIVARKEIDTYGLPTIRHYELSIEKGEYLANIYGADVNLVRAGVALMDVKLGQAAKESKQTQHVQMSKEFAEQILTDLGVEEPYYSVLVNCVEAHHGTIPFVSIEAEITANADCYRFIHPRGVMSFYATVIKRGNEHNTALKTVETKLDEKRGILSLEAAKEDLVKYYEMFKEILTKGLDD